MSLLDIYKEFPVEASTRKKFRVTREKECAACKKCKNMLHYWKNGKECFECKKFHFGTTLRSSAEINSSKLYFLQWFIAMHLSAATKKSFYDKEIQRQLDRKHYELQQANELLLWVKIAISNAKQLLLDVQYIVDVDFLKDYLNECCWKFSQRHINNPLFNRILVCKVSSRREYLGQAKVYSLL